MHRVAHLVEPVKPNCKRTHGLTSANSSSASELQEKKKEWKGNKFLKAGSDELGG